MSARSFRLQKQNTRHDPEDTYGLPSITVRPDTARAEDSWRLRLERVRGKVGDDGIERVSTQTLFDHLEVAQRGRGAGACRRLATLMRGLGWTPVRVRDLTRGGYKEQVRGYCRDAWSRFAISK